MEDFGILGLVTRRLVQPYRPAQLPSRLVAIVVPLSTRETLTAEEEISMRHLKQHLGHYDKCLVVPKGHSFRREGFAVAEFNRRFFGSAAAINHLNFWPGLYRTFSNYRFILIYHLDSLVFSDQLREWCERDLDYIGAPWIPCPDTPWVQDARVGNGGFALIKVESALKVLCNRHRMEPATFWMDLLTRNASRLPLAFRTLEWLQRFLPRSRIVKRPVAEWQQMQRPELHGRNNDIFWSFHAGRYLPEFKLASVEEGLRFAFEAAPRTCFELNQRKLPFGCHAWPRYDRAFWEPHLLNS